MKKLLSLLILIPAIVTTSTSGVLITKKNTPTRWIEQMPATGSDVRFYQNIGKSYFTDQGAGGDLTQQYTTPKSGYYLFTESCSATTLTTAGNNAMLYINNDNVVIDLGANAIGESTGGSVTPVDIIVIDANNVTIRNGTISAAAGGAAIRVTAGKKDIKLHNLTIKDCITEGIHIDGNSGAGNDVRSVQITNCTIQDVTKASQAVAGILAEYVDDLLIENVACTNILGNAANSDAIKLDNCSHVRIKNVDLANNSTTTSGTLNGVLLTTTTVSKLENCTIQGNSSAGELHGIQLTSGSTGNHLKNCHLFSNTASNSSMGIHINDSTNDSNYNTVDECQVVYQKSTSTTAANQITAYMSEGCIGNYFLNSTARGCSASTNNDATGFKLDTGDTQGHIENCISSDHDAAANAYGIYVADGVVDAVITGNKLYGSKGTTAGYGIKDANTDSRCLYQRNFAYGNMADGGTVTNYDVTPDNDAQTFPKATGHVNNFTIYEMRDSVYNFEILG